MRLKITAGVLVSLLGTVLFPVAAQASYKCDFLPQRPAPSWVEKRPDLQGYYVGVGSAEMRETAEEQIEASQANALVNLGKEISVSVSSAFTETLSADETGQARQEIESTTETRVQELLRDAKVKEKWLDRKNCMLWTLMTVSRESVEAVQKEIAEKLAKKFSSKKAMIFPLSAHPGETDAKAVSAFGRVLRDLGVRVVASQAKYLPCAKGQYTKLCDEQADTMYGGFTLTFDKEKLSNDGNFKARFFKFAGALYFKDRSVSAFTIQCRGVANSGESSAAIDLIAADTCVSDIKKKLKADMQGGE